MLRCTAPLAALLAAHLAAQTAPPTLRLERELVLRGGSSSSLAWSPDGKWIAAGGYAGEVLVVDAQSGKVRHELLASDYWTGALRFTPDGSALFVGGRALTRWDLGTGKETARVALAHPCAMALSRDGRRVAHAEPDGKIAVRAAADLQLERELVVPDETACDSLAFDASGERLAVGNRSGHTYEFSLASGQLLARHDQPGWVQSLAYLDDGRLVRLDWEGTLLGLTAEPLALGGSAWGMSIDDGAGLCVTWGQSPVRGFTNAGPAFTVAGSGPAAVHPSDRSWVRAHDEQLEFFRDAECVRTLPLAHRAPPGNCVFVDGGRHLAIGRGRSTVLCDLASGALVPLPCELPGQPLVRPGTDELVLWSQTTEPLAFVSQETLTFWSVATLRAGRTEPIRQWRLGDFDVDWGLPVFSRDGRHLAVGNTIRDALQPAVVQWRLPEGGEYQWAQPLPGGAAAWRVSRWGRFNSDVQLCRADGKHEAKTELWGRWILDWSPNGTRVLVASTDRVDVVDAKTMQPVTTIRAQVPAAWLDDQRLVVFDGEGHLSIVDAANGEVVAHAQLPVRYGRITVAADGRRCAVVMDDRVVIVRIGGD
jgi:YD repeat-containing protein